MTDATESSFGAVGNNLVLTTPSARPMQLGCKRPKIRRGDALTVVSDSASSEPWRCSPGFTVDEPAGKIFGNRCQQAFALLVIPARHRQHAQL